MVRALVVASLLVACGDNRAATPAPVDAPPATCSATFAGNFAEQSSAAADCATLMPGTGVSAGDVVLALALPSHTLATTLGISIDLGVTATAGESSSETTATWSALAIESVPTGACVFTAGTVSIPTGSFTLELATVDTADAIAHGVLAITLYVLAETTEQGMQTECGAGSTESLRAAF